MGQTLSRIGQSIQEHPSRNTFLTSLAFYDPLKAAIVLQAAPLAYEPCVRSTVVHGMAQEIFSRCRVRGAFVIELLGTLACPEATDCLLEALNPSAECPFHLRTAGTFALAGLAPPEERHLRTCCLGSPTVATRRTTSAISWLFFGLPAPFSERPFPKRR